MRNRGALALALTILLLSLPLSNTVQAAAADLDASFGFTGIDDSNTADNTCACR